MTTTPSSLRLPTGMLRPAHAGACYDRIGAFATIGGAVGGTVLAVVAAAAESLLDGSSMTLAAVLPDPATAGIAGGALALLAPAALLYVHRRVHRALAREETVQPQPESEHGQLLVQAMLRVAQGDLDRQAFAALAEGAGFGDAVDELLACIDEAAPPAEVGEEVLAA